MLISARKLRKSYGESEILKGIDLKVNESEIVVLLGESGAGKSTLLGILSGLIEDYEGEITRSNDFLESDIPMPVVFQEFDQLLPWLTVKDNVMLPHKKTGELDKKCDEVLGFVSLLMAKDKYPSELSGGMKQRAAIARAILCGAKVIFMDEPFGSLDEELRKKMQGLTLEMKEKYGTSILFITHDKNEAKILGDRVLSLENGKVREIIL